MKEALKILVKRTLRRLGHGLPCEDYLNKYAFGYHLARLFRLRNAQCVIDVGAHVGGYGMFLRNEVGYKGLIISFEPVNDHLRALERLARSNGPWRVYPYALGSQSESRKIHVMKVGVFSSFLEPDHSNVGDFQSRNEALREEQVEIKTLDGMMPVLERDIGHPLRNVYLKVDTQGFDLEVLHGASRTLQALVGVQTEASVHALYKGSVPFTQVLDYLQQRGFAVSGMFPVVRDKELRLVEFDLVMTRSDQSMDNPETRA